MSRSFPDTDYPSADPNSTVGANDVETVTSTGEHNWMRDDLSARGWHFCTRCGIVRRADGKNKPCVGTVHVEPR